MAFSDPFKEPNYVKDSAILDNYTSKEEWQESLVEASGAEPTTIEPLFDFSRLKFLAFIVGIFLVALLARLFYLQVMNSTVYTQAAEENRFRIQTVRAPRGVLYDRTRKLIVKNIPSFDLTVVPADLPHDSDKRSELLGRLRAIVPIPDETIQKLEKNIAENTYQTMTLLENVDRDQALILETQTNDFPGVHVETNPQRDYQDASLFSHLVGYTGKLSPEDMERLSQDSSGQYLPNDSIGKTGLEVSYEKELRGTHGRQQVEVDSSGRVEKVLAAEPAEPGSDLVLSIDADLQRHAADALAKHIPRDGKEGGTVIAIDPRNGRVRALVSLPSFDNNIFSGKVATDEYNRIANDPSRPLFNRALSGTYPPGSTVKPVVATAALAEHVVTPNTTIVDRGTLDVPSQYDPSIIYHFVGWNRAGLGPMNVYSAIAKSSDIYFYTVSGGFGDIAGLGAEKLVEYYRKFGMGSVLGIDIPGEAAGLVPTPEWKEKNKQEAWYLGDTYHIGIGQGDLLVTPLQVAAWTMAVANGGTLYQPQLVEKIIRSNEHTVRELEPKTVRTALADKNAIIEAQKGMRETVLSGSGAQLSSEPFTVAGKTGTAQYANNQKTHAWFTSYAPYENPELVVVVLVEGGGEGNETAIPVAKEVLEWYFSSKQSSDEL